MKKFVLVDGYISLDNKQLFIDINNTKKDLKNRGGLSVILFVFLGISVFRNLKNDNYFEKVSHYIDFGIRVIGMIAIVAIIYYLLFLRKSEKNLIINDILKIEVEKKEFETEITIVFSSKREFDISFRNLENQTEPFLEELKKRNSRIEIKH